MQLIITIITGCAIGAVIAIMFGALIWYALLKDTNKDDEGQ